MSFLHILIRLTNLYDLKLIEFCVTYTHNNVTMVFDPIRVLVHEPMDREYDIIKFKIKLLRMI